MTNIRPAQRAFSPRYSRLSLAALALGVFSSVLVVATWCAWFFVVPSLREPVTILPSPQPAVPVSIVGIVIGLVVGGLWFATLPLSTMAIVFGFLAHRRSAVLFDAHEKDSVARTAVVLGIIALALALVGCLTCAVSAHSSFPVMDPVGVTITGQTG